MARPISTVWLLTLAACASGANAPVDGLAARADTDKPDLLVVGDAESGGMRTLLDTLHAEIGSDFDVWTLPVAATRGRDLSVAIDAVGPRAVVLMDNPAVELYRSYQRTHTGPTPAGIVVMALLLDEATAGLENTTGIAYEVPAITSLVNLRQSIGTPVVRVGVVHRPRFAGFVAEQAAIATREGFEVVPVAVGAHPSPTSVHRAVRRLRGEVDALWILNDNALLTQDLVLDVWLPELEKAELPVVVGVQSLLQTPTPFGSFAVLPDHDGLGLQVADLVFELEHAGWDADRVAPQLPIAVETVMNVRLARAHHGFREERVAHLDRIVE